MPGKMGKRLTTILQAMEDGIYIINEDFVLEIMNRSLGISTLFDEGLPDVFASKNQLRQVFPNMVSNARDAMPEGGTLTVATRSDNGRILIEISDTGTGVDQKHLDKIFDAFLPPENCPCT